MSLIMWRSILEIGILNGAESCYIPYEIFAKGLNLSTFDKKLEDKMIKTTAEIKAFSNFLKSDAITKYI